VLVLLLQELEVPAMELVLPELEEVLGFLYIPLKQEEVPLVTFMVNLRVFIRTEES